MTTLLVCALSLGFAALAFAAPGLVNGAFDLVDAALGWLGPFWVVTLVSAVTGVLFIAAFPHVSAQGAIVKVKDRIKVQLLAIRLFQDEMRVVGRSVVGALGWNLAYLGLNVLPLVVLALPFIVVWSQLSGLYAYQPLEPGDELVVVAELGRGIDPAEVEIVPPDGGTVVRRADLVGRLAFVLRADRQASSALTFRYAGTEVTKRFEVATRPRRLARNRTAQPWTDFAAARDPLLYFGEPVLPPDSFLRSVFVEYPVAPLGPFGGGEIAIMILFVVVSMAVGFGLKDVFGVEL